jgi:putative RecB family exonuclease
VALSPPSTLSPSKVEAFGTCPLAFRLASIDKLPELPTPAAVKGTLVHRALELLFCLAPEGRTLEAALGCLADAVAELAGDEEYVALALDEEAAAGFAADAERLVRRYFLLEDPTVIRPIGVELRMEAEVGGITLRGIIDRLELDADGELVVTDYKTGRTPRERDERGRLGGVHFYSLLCEQVLGRRPKEVQLLYLGEPVAIVARPSEQSTRFLAKKVAAVWTAVERACEHDDFRPRPGRLCDWCGFKAYCPAFGGDLALAAQARAEAAAPTAVAVQLPVAAIA